MLENNLNIRETNKKHFKINISALLSHCFFFFFFLVNLILATEKHPEVHPKPMVLTPKGVEGESQPRLCLRAGMVWDEFPVLCLGSDGWGMVAGWENGPREPPGAVTMGTGQ